MNNVLKVTMAAAMLTGMAQVSAVAAVSDRSIAVSGRPTLTPTNPAAPPRIAPPPRSPR